MKILLAGDWRWEMYDQALATGLAHHGAQVIPFRTSAWDNGGMLGRLEARLEWGPSIRRMNRMLVEATSHHRPDLIFLNLPIFVLAESAAAMRLLPKVTIVTYNHDNPFEDGRSFFWRHYHRLVKNADLNFFVRPSTVQLARSLGVPRPHLLRQYYAEGLHRPLPSATTQQAGIAFIGHYEPDGRESYCDALRARGLPLRIFGSRWGELPWKSPLRKIAGGPIYGEDYVRTICRAKINLVFLSGVNRDPYTTRCFEIPACGGFMLAPRTPELQALYEEGREAEYFSSPGELCEKAAWYLDHGDERQRIANAGYLRCLRDRHSNVDRAGEILREAHEFREQQEGTRE
jgi:spore maturation protein CgeB